MPIRVGLDLVSSDSIREAIRVHGERYLERVYSPREISDSSTETSLDAARLAARFAAKEATFKALRVGDAAVSWRDVEVLRDASGFAQLMLSGAAATLALDSGIAHLALSLSHRGGLAVAVVIAEIRRSADTVGNQ
jgi:holo-[acyl-carrier protein] synthase